MKSRHPPLYFAIVGYKSRCIQTSSAVNSVLQNTTDVFHKVLRLMGKVTNPVPCAVPLLVFTPAEDFINFDFCCDLKEL